MYKEEAIPLITFDPYSKKYSITDEATKLIQSITTPIGVISVAGLYRTGKSYLLNRIVLNRSNGFGVGPTVNPCTKGMWVWGTPIRVGDLSILIVDSEGTGALSDSDANHDTRIFALAILLASTFVYNSVGAIDEGALESLSLVVNLTKFIQLKQTNEEPDGEEYSDYMPSFFWVLRDFSLQLLDNNGDQLTSHQYLERSLQEQQGFSDVIEEKNRIRRLLRTFFPERECFTLVRPVLNESQLQQLQTLELKQLRPEFSDQAMNLKKMLFTKVKPKQLHGKSLNGQMYINLMQQYLNAINNGAVANIESSWSYVFKEECRRLSGEAFEVYERLMNEKLGNKLPTREEDIKMVHKKCRIQALMHMSQMMEEGGVEEFIRELKQRMKQRVEQILQLNENESMNYCKQWLISEYAELDKKLKMNEFKNMQQYLQARQLFANFIFEKGPVVAKSRQIYYEFLYKTEQDALLFFLNKSSQELQQQKQYSEEQINQLQQQKQEAIQQLDMQQINLKEYQSQNNDLKERQNKYQKELEQVKQKNSELMHTMKYSHQEEITKYTTMTEELRNKAQQLEDRIKSQEREAFIKQSESQKHQALLEQKIQHLTRQMEESSKKELQLDHTLSNSKNEYTLKLRELTQHYEQQLGGLAQQNLQLNEKLQEASDASVQFEIKYENLQQSLQQKENQHSQIVKQLQQNLQQIQEQLNNEIKSNKMLKDDLLQNQALSEDQEQIEQLRNQLKQQETQNQEMKQQQLKQQAILSQKIEFLQMELQDKIQSIQDIKKSHEQAITAMEESQHQQSSQNQINKQLIDMKEQYMNEQLKLEQQFNQQKKQLQIELEQIRNELEETQRKCQMLINEKDNLTEMVKESFGIQEELKERIQQQMKDLESSKYQQIRDKEVRLNQRIKQLEDEVTSYKKQLNTLSTQHQQNIEQQICELRNYYESEKDVLERRIHEERMKADQKYQVLFEEQEQKYIDEQQQYEEDIEQLREELRDLEMTYMNLQKQYENDMELKNKQIQQQELLQNETKEQLVIYQQQFQEKLDQKTQQYTLQIQQLESQISVEQFNHQQLNAEYGCLQQKNIHLEGLLIQKNEENKALKDDQEKEKQTLQSLNDELRTKYATTCDEYLERKINYERSIALSAQQNEFLAKKVQELERQLDISNKRYEERYKQQKKEWSDELQEKLQKLNEEKQNIEIKLQQVKKTLREKETHLIKLQQDLEKESALSTEKIKFLENKLRDHELQTSSEQSTSATQLKALREQFSLFKLNSQKENENLKQNLQQSEFEKQELQATYEKDKTLWQGKAEFFESQKESLKIELQESRSKFEATLQQLQKQRNLERNDHNFQEMLSSIERKYQDQIRDLQENANKLEQEYQEKIDKLEREIKALQNKELMDQQAKVGLQFERKAAELLENEKRLLSQIDELKADRDQRLTQHQNEIDSEKQYWKEKLTDLEERLREAEKKHSQLIFFHEKERAKWNQEKDYIQQQKLELQDSLQRLEKKKELLLRENEKMKNSSKSQRKYNPNQTFVGSGLNTSYMRNQTSDKKQGSTLSLVNKDINMSCDVSKSLEDDQKEKENLSTSTTFGSFKRYYQMMNSKQASPSKQQFDQQNI